MDVFIPKIEMSFTDDDADFVLRPGFGAVDEDEAYLNLKMKRKKCSIEGCTIYSKPVARSYHQMPTGLRNDHIRELWLNAIRRSKNDAEWVPPHLPVLVCSRHFEDDCYRPTKRDPTRFRLLQNAVPTRYLGDDENDLDNNVDRPRNPHLAELRPESIKSIKGNSMNAEEMSVEINPESILNSGNDNEELTSNGIPSSFKILTSGTKITLTTKSGSHRSKLNGHTSWSHSIIEDQTLFTQGGHNEDRMIPPLKRAKTLPKLTAIPRISNGSGMRKSTPNSFNHKISDSHSEKNSRPPKGIKLKVAMEDGNIGMLNIDAATCMEVVNSIDHELKDMEKKLSMQLGLPLKAIQTIWRLRSQVERIAVQSLGKKEGGYR